MPAYEYQCDACARHFEQRQKMSESPIESCPECGGAVKRLISGGAGTISKGGGHHSSGYDDTQSACAMGGPCCGQGAACGNKTICEQ
jgi:putative FmdB family regulatory protein